MHNINKNTELESVLKQALVKIDVILLSKLDKYFIN